MLRRLQVGAREVRKRVRGSGVLAEIGDVPGAERRTEDQHADEGGIVGEEVVEERDVEEDLVIEDARAASHDGLAVPSRVPCESESRADIVHVVLQRAAFESSFPACRGVVRDRLPDEGLRHVERPELDVVAKPEIENEPVTDRPVVLDVDAHLVVGPARPGVPEGAEERVGRGVGVVHGVVERSRRQEGNVDEQLGAVDPVHARLPVVVSRVIREIVLELVLLLDRLLIGEVVGAARQVRKVKDRIVVDVPDRVVEVARLEDGFVQRHL
ncbi:MAG: hypothetical protein U0166_23910 [Acidobacteriota bacterium]